MTRKFSGTTNKLNRRRLLKGAAAGGAVVATEAIGGFPTVWAQNIKDVTLVACRRLLCGDQGDRRAGQQGPGLQDRDAGHHRRRPAQPLADAAEHHRHQQHRQHQAALPRGQGRAGADPGRQIQAVGRDRAALHQGRVSRRQDGLDAGPGADRGDVLRRQGRQEARRQADRVSDLRSRRSTTPTRSASVPTWSAAATRSTTWKDLLDPKFKGKTALVDYPADRHHGRRHGARSRAATSSTATRAT